MPHTRPRIVLVGRCFVRRADGYLLLLKRASTNKNYPGFWECPGGKIDGGQDLVEARSRELIEETGCLVTPHTGLSYVDSYIIKTGRYEGMLYLAIFNVMEYEKLPSH